MTVYRMTLETLEEDDHDPEYLAESEAIQIVRMLARDSRNPRLRVLIEEMPRCESCVSYKALEYFPAGGSRGVCALLTHAPNPVYVPSKHYCGFHALARAANKEIMG